MTAAAYKVSVLNNTGEKREWNSNYNSAMATVRNYAKHPENHDAIGVEVIRTRDGSALARFDAATGLVYSDSL